MNTNRSTVEDQMLCFPKRPGRYHDSTAWKRMNQERVPSFDETSEDLVNPARKGKK